MTNTALSPGSADRAYVHTRGEPDDRHFLGLIHDLDAIIWEADAITWRFTFVSRQAERLLGYPVARWLNEPGFWAQMVHPEDRDASIAYRTQCTQAGRDHDFSYRAIAADGRVVWLQDSVRVVRDDAGQPTRLRGIMTDITRRKRAEAISDAYRQTLEQIAQGESLQSILATLCGLIEGQLGRGAKASILQLEQGRLHHLVAPQLPLEYTRKLDGLVIGPKMGSCGTAAHRVEPVLVGDVAHDPLWAEFRDLADRFGLRACWSVPILSVPGEVLGTFAVYYPDPCDPTDEDVVLLTTMARAASIALERNRAGEELRRSEQRLRGTFEQAAVGMAHVALDGRWIRVNQRLCDIVGYSHSEMMNLTFQQITHPDDLEADLEQVRLLLAGQIQTYAMEKRYICKDGSPVWINLTVSLRRDDHGVPLYFISVIEDIGRRKQAERQLSERAGQQQQLYQLIDAMNRASGLEEIYQVALQAILDAVHADRASILLFDGEGIMRFRAWRGLSDSYRQAVEGHDPWDGAQHPRPLAIDDVSAAELETNLLRTIQHEGISAMSFIPLTYQGRLLGKFMVYYNALHRFTQEELLFSQTIATQLAFAIERRRGEEALVEAKEHAEAASSAKDRFLAVLSHELRTPLTPVVMTIAAMEQHPKLPDDLREELAMIRRNIDLETKLIDDLLDLSRVANGKLRLQIERVRIHELLQHVQSSCAGEAAAKKLSVICELSAENDVVQGDPARLQQVFWNILKNALKFTPEGGRVTIRSWNPNPDHVLVELQDTGVGIDQQVLPRLFNAFEQGDVHVTRQFGGLGLGLAIAKAVLDLHSGAIAADSDGPGRGTAFVVELPTAELVHEQAPAAPAKARKQRRTGHTRILLVEDHPDSARMLSRYLARLGYIVRTAHSVKSALALASAEGFDILISDIGLPDATGYDLMREIRSRHAIKGIALSGYGMEEDMKRSREAGFLDHVVKPVNVARLEAVIQRITTGD